MNILSIQQKHTQNSATSVELLSLVHRSTLRSGEMTYRVAFSMMALNINKSLIYFEKEITVNSI